MYMLLPNPLLLAATPHMPCLIHDSCAGSEYKVDASYLSPNVNMAARLEAATKQFGVSLLLSKDFVDCLSPAVQARVSQSAPVMQCLCADCKTALQPVLLFGGKMGKHHIPTYCTKDLTTAFPSSFCNGQSAHDCLTYVQPVVVCTKSVVSHRHAYQQPWHGRTLTTRHCYALRCGPPQRPCIINSSLWAFTLLICLFVCCAVQVRQIDCVTVKGSNHPVGLFTYDIDLQAAAEAVANSMSGSSNFPAAPADKHGQAAAGDKFYQHGSSSSGVADSADDLLYCEYDDDWEQNPAIANSWALSFGFKQQFEDAFQVSTDIAPC